MNASNPVSVEGEEQIPLVLVVDDSPTLREFVASILRKKYRVATAKDGAEGLELTARIQPDLIICDVLMPRLNGFELCAAVKRAGGQLSRVPVILVSAQGEVSNKIDGFEHGADDYLVKPFNADELFARSRNLIRLREQEKQLHETQMRLVESQRKALEMEIALARQVQSSILPKTPECRLPGVELKGLVMSAAQCSGDFWTYHELPDNKLLVTLADATGHGVGSAMITELAYGVLTAMVRSSARITPAHILNEINAIVGGESIPLWITMVAGILDPKRGEAVWANAGHPPICYAADGQPVKYIHSSGQPLGASRETTFTDTVVPISKRTRFLAYSDGLTDAQNPANGRTFGLRRVAATMAQPHAGASACLEALRTDLTRFVGEDTFDDDVTVVAAVVEPV